MNKQRKVRIYRSWVDLMKSLERVDPDGYETLVAYSLGLAFNEPGFEECVFGDPILQHYWERTMIKKAEDGRVGYIKASGGSEYGN